MSSMLCHTHVAHKWMPLTSARQASGRGYQPEDAKPNEELVSVLAQVEFRWNSQTYVGLCETHKCRPFKCINTLIQAARAFLKQDALSRFGSHLIFLGQEVVGVCLEFGEVCFEVTDFDWTEIFNRRKKITGWITVIIYPVGLSSFLKYCFFLPASFPVPRNGIKRKRNTSSVSWMGRLIHDAMLK